MKFCQLFLLLIVFNIYGQKQNQSIGFIENRGQIIDQKGRKNNVVKYLLNTNGLNVQLRKNGFSYDVYETKKHPLTKKQKERLNSSDIINEDTLKKPNYTLEYLYHRIEIDFENSNQSVKLIAEEKSSDYDNYYNVPNEPNGITNVYKFQKVTYKNIYNNIDIVFFIPEDKSKPVEYNFIVNLGGKLSDIQLKFNGVKTELIDNKIKMNVRFGQMEETLPLSWSENGTAKNEIAIGYKKIKNNVYGFESSEDLNNKKVVIDPVPVRLWGTYYGGNGDETIGDITTNLNNDVFISGNSSSLNNIATSGTFQTILQGNSNLFFAKFNTNGIRVWGTYFFSDLGNYNSHSAIIKVDNNNNLYFASEELYDSNLATSGAFQLVKNANTDVFLGKLDSDGLRIWLTYYGGNVNETVNSMCIDSQNNIYICGETSSTDMFGSTGSYQINNNSNPDKYDGFIAKFAPNGNRIWGTFYGGLGSDGFLDISISNDNYIYLSGSHNSLTNIATPNSHQPTTNITPGGMIVKFDLNGQRIWGTYICNDSFIFNAELKDDDLYISGITRNQIDIGTPNTFHEIFQTLPPGSNLLNYSGINNGYIIKFNVQSQLISWGTYFPEFITSLVVNSNDEIIFGGFTNINSGIATPNAYMINCTYDDYLVKLNSSGQRIWGTYFGGNGGEQLAKLAIDNLNNVYLYGMTLGSTGGIATANGHQPNLGSNPDTFLIKFKDCLSSTTATSNTPTCIGSNLNLTASGGTNYSWSGPNGFTSNLQNPTITNVTALNAGQYTCNITGTSDCDGIINIDVIVGDSIKPIPNINPLPTITGDCTTTATFPTATDNCAGTITATTSDPLSYSLPGTYTIHWNYNDGNGNIETQNQTVIVNAVTLPTALSPQTFCIQQNATLNTITIIGQNIKWYDAPTGGNLLPNTTILQDVTTYYASQTINSCESLRMPVTIKIQNTSVPTGTGTQTFCSTQNATLSDISIAGSNINWYNSTTNPTVLSSTTVLTNGTTYYASQTINGCESLSRLPVTVSIINSLNANNYSQSFCDDLNDGLENVLLTDYNSNLVTSTTNTIFTYYPTLLSAQNQVINQQLNSNYSLNLGLNTIYVRLESTNGCHQIVKLELTLFPKPTISINDVMPICKTNNIIVDAGAGFNSYLWSTGATTQSITITQAGNYSVIVTQNHGSITCSSIKNFTVVLSNIATITTIETQDWTDNENIIIVNLTTSSTGNYEYSLDGIHYQDSNIFSGLYSGNYTVYVHDKNECGIATKDVFLLTYPKFFTPNGDGNNDTWKIKFSQYEPGLKVKIFDRYGKQIKSLEKTSSWDGTNNGELMLSDDYWFIVTRANGKEHKGHFTLKR